MSTTVKTDLELLCEFVAVEVQRDKKQSVSAVLAAWKEREETITAIREGLEDVKAGRTQPLEEWWTEFKERNGIEGRQ